MRLDRLGSRRRGGTAAVVSELPTPDASAGAETLCLLLQRHGEHHAAEYWPIGWHLAANRPRPPSAAANCVSRGGGV